MKVNSVHVKIYVNKTVLYSLGLGFCYGYPGAKTFRILRETDPRSPRMVTVIGSALLSLKHLHLKCTELNARLSKLRKINSRGANLIQKQGYVRNHKVNCG